MPSRPSARRPPLQLAPWPWPSEPWPSAFAFLAAAVTGDVSARAQGHHLAKRDGDRRHAVADAIVFAERNADRDADRDADWNADRDADRDAERDAHRDAERVAHAHAQLQPRPGAAAVPRTLPRSHQGACVPGKTWHLFLKQDSHGYNLEVPAALPLQSAAAL